jgi:LCP family protein required for cell wall assembly
MGTTPTAAAERPARPWIAALASAIVPGTGQLIAGARRRAMVLLLIDAGLIAFAAVAAMNRTEVAKAWVRPTALSFMMLGNLVLLGFRMWAADDAYRLAAGGSSGTRAWAAPALAGLAIVVVAPHAVATLYTAEQYDFIVNTFADEDVAAPAPPTPGAPGVTVPAVVEPALWDGLERLNILLLGADSGAGRRDIRTDTMIVVSIDPVTGSTAMFSIPRNYARAPLPEGVGIWDCNCFPQLLNDLYWAGGNYPDAFPGPGTPQVNAIKAAMTELLGIEIHYYMLVTLDGFVGIVDALGGVEMTIPVTIIDEEYPHEDGVTVEYMEIPAGTQVLDGHEALAYARMRRNADDYARMNRQRCVLEAVLEQSSPAELALKYTQIIGAVQEALETDIPTSRLDDFIDLLEVVDTESILTMRVLPDPYFLEADAFGQNVYDAELIREHAQLILNSPEVAAQQLGLSSLDATCE